MERITEGSWLDLRKRITWAMSDPYKFKIYTGECIYNEKKVTGQTIELNPYKDDYDSKKFKKYSKKKYFITLCDDIPGMVYEMATIVPSEDSEEPLMKETLTFDKILKLFIFFYYE